VNGHGQFDHAKARAQVPAGDRDRVDGLLPQFVGNLAKLAGVKLPQMRWGLEAVQERRLAGSGHDEPSEC